MFFKTVEDQFFKVKKIEFKIEFYINNKFDFTANHFDESSQESGSIYTIDQYDEEEVQEEYGNQEEQDFGN